MDDGHYLTELILRETEADVTRVYRQAVDEITKKLEEYLRKYKVKDLIKQQQLQKGEITLAEYNYWKTGQIAIGQRWEEMKNTLAQDLHNANNIARSVVKGHMPDVYAVNHDYATFQVEKDSLVDTSYTLYNRQAVERLIRDQPDVLPEPGPKMREKLAANKDLAWQKGQIQSVMIQTIVQGESIPNMAKRICTTLGEKNRKASVRYARTATTAVQNAGRVDAYQRAQGMGIDLEQEWLATLDGRTRHEHRYLDGQHVKVGEPFLVDGYEIEFPGDPKAPGYLIWNCRCTLVPRVKGVDQSNAPRNSKLGDMSYDEWKHEHDRPDENIYNNSSDVIKKPVRPRRSDFVNEDDYTAARDAYRLQKKKYDDSINSAVEKSMEHRRFTTKEEVVNWANKHGISIDESVFDKVDIRAFSETSEALDEMFRRFPKAKDFQYEYFDGSISIAKFGIGLWDDGLLSANGGFNFNPLHFADYADGLRQILENQASGFFVRGDGTFSSAVRHEYGHRVMEYIESKLSMQYHQSVDNWRLNFDKFEDYKSARDGYLRTKNKFEQELLSLVGTPGSSEYSNTNIGELFAEGFAEFTSGGSTEFGRKFGEFLMRWY